MANQVVERSTGVIGDLKRPPKRSTRATSLHMVTTGWRLATRSKAPGRNGSGPSSTVRTTTAECAARRPRARHSHHSPALRWPSDQH